MIDKINSENLPDFVEKPSNQQPEKVRSAPDTGKQDSIQVSFTDLVDQAKAAVTDPDAVQQAKQLLISGQLDTPENITSAAEQIIKYGI